MKNNISTSKWVTIDCKPLPIGLSEMDIIKCNKCNYITHPIVLRYEINNKKFGKLKLPKICSQCKAIMIKE